MVMNFSDLIPRYTPEGRELPPPSKKKWKKGEVDFSDLIPETEREIIPTIAKPVTTPFTAPVRKPSPYDITALTLPKETTSYDMPSYTASVAPTIQPERPAGLYPAPKPTFIQKAKETIVKPFVKTPEARIAEAQNIYAMSQSEVLKLTPQERKHLTPHVKEKLMDMRKVELSEVGKYYDKLRRQSEVTGIAPSPRLQDVAALPIGVGVAYGIMTNPLTTIAGIALYKAMEEAENAVISKIKRKPYVFGSGENIASLLPEEVNETTKDVVDILDFMAKGYLIKTVYKKAPKVVEKLTKQTIEKYNLPKKFYLSGEQIKNIRATGKLTTAEQKSMFRSLGVDIPTERQMWQTGTTIEIPAEKIITVMDKPYWGKVKGLFKIKPSIETRVVSTGKPTITPIRGELPAPTGKLPITPTLPVEKAPIIKPAVPAVMPKAEAKPIITDPERVQEIKNSIAEGKMILKSGKTSFGKTMSEGEIEGIRRSVENAQAKIGIKEGKLPPHLQKLVDKQKGFAIDDVTPEGYGPAPLSQPQRLSDVMKKAEAPAPKTGEMKLYRGGEKIKLDKIGRSGISFSKDKNIAEFYLKGDKLDITDGVIEEFYLDENARLFDINELPKNIQNKLNSINAQEEILGKEDAVYYIKDNFGDKYDGVDFSQDVQSEVRIFNPAVIKTKKAPSSLVKEAMKYETAEEFVGSYFEENTEQFYDIEDITTNLSPQTFKKIKLDMEGLSAEYFFRYDIKNNRIINREVSQIKGTPKSAKANLDKLLGNIPKESEYSFYIHNHNVDINNPFATSEPSCADIIAFQKILKENKKAKFLIISPSDISQIELKHNTAKNISDLTSIWEQAHKKVTLPEEQQMGLPITETALPLEERASLLERAGYTEEAEKLRRTAIKASREITLDIEGKEGHTISEGSSDYYELPDTGRRAVPPQDEQRISKLISNSPLKVKYKKQGYFKFPQEKISSPADIAFAFSELKNEAVEKMYVIGFKGDIPICVEPVGVGLIDRAIVSAYEPLHLLLTKEADGFALTHNHPGRQVQISEPDLKTTEAFQKVYQKHNLEFKGHAIMDTVEFGWYSPTGGFEKLPMPKANIPYKKIPQYSKYIDWVNQDVLQVSMKSPEELVSFVKGLGVDWNDNSGVIYTDNQNRIVATELLSLKQITSSNLAKTSVGLRANAIFLINSKFNPSELANLKTELLEYPIRIVDSVDFKESGEFTSAVSDSRLAEEKAHYKPKAEEIIHPEAKEIKPKKLKEKIRSIYERIEKEKLIRSKPKRIRQLARVMSLEDKAIFKETPDLRKQVRDLGGIKPYKEGFLTEEYRDLPQSVKNKNGMAGDEMAAQLGIDNDDELFERLKWEQVDKPRPFSYYLEDAQRLIEEEEGIIKVGKLVQEDVILGLVEKGQEMVAREVLSAGKKIGVFTQREKFKEMVTRARERKVQREKIKKMVSDIKGIDLAKMSPAEAEPIRDLLQSLDLVKRQKPALLRLAKTKQFIETHPDAEMPDYMLEKLTRLEQRNLNEISLDELEIVHNATMHYAHLNKTKQLIRIGREIKRAHQVLEDSISEMKPPKEVKSKIVQSQKSKLGALKRVGDLVVDTMGIRHDHYDLIIETLAGANSTMDKVLYQGIKEGRIKELAHRQKTFSQFQEDIDLENFQKKHKIKDIADWKNEKVKIGDFNLTRGERMSLYRHSLNEDNLRHIIEGGFGLKNSNTPFKPNPISQKELNAILEDLTPAELEFAGKPVKSLFDKQYEALNDVFYKKNGYPLPKVEEYYPIEVMRTSLPKELEAESILEELKHKWIKIGIIKWMLEDRKKSKLPIYLNDIAWDINKSVLNAAAYVGLEIPMSDASKLFYNKTFKAELINRYGATVYYEIEKGLRDMAGDFQSYSTVEELALKLKNKMSTAILGLNPFVMAKQILSYSLYSVYVKPEYLAAGFIDFTTHPIETSRRHKLHSSEFLEREEGGYSRDVVDIFKTASAKRLFKGKKSIAERLMGGVKLLDAGAVIPGMQGAVLQALDEFKKGKLSSDVKTALDMQDSDIVKLSAADKMKQAYKFADWVTERTQPMFSVEHRSSLSRGTAIEKLFTQFTAFTNQALNLIRRTWREARRTNDPKMYAKLLKVLFLLLVVNTGGVMVIDEIRDRLYRRKEKTKRGLLPKAGEAILDSSASYFYFVRDIERSVVSKVKKGTFTGYDISIPVLSATNLFIDAFSDGIGALVEKDSAKRKKRAMKFVDGGIESLLLTQGLPYSTPKKIIKGFIPEKKKSKYGVQFKKSKKETHPILKKYGIK